MRNPYQPVIDWLESPAGECWSNDRLARAHMAQDGSCLDGFDPGTGEAFLVGMFSLKYDHEHWWKGDKGYDR